MAGTSVAVGGIVRFWLGAPSRADGAQEAALSGTVASDREVEARPTPAQRLISLSPGVTETLVELGLGAEIVGISDYCFWSLDQGHEPARVGSALTPRYEAIARLRPTGIVASDVAGGQLEPLSELAPTHSLPWLTVAQFASSVRLLGSLLGRREQGRLLGERVESALSRTAPPTAPAVLFAFDSGGGSTNETWFIRRNSIHGAVLRAAGGKNAVQEDIVGQPKLSPEELLRLDPEIILVLRGREPDAEKERRAKQRFSALTPLRAVREGRVYVFSSPKALSVGPSVLDLIAPLRKLLAAQAGAGLKVPP